PLKRRCRSDRKRAEQTGAVFCRERIEEHPGDGSVVALEDEAIKVRAGRAKMRAGRWRDRGEIHGGAPQSERMARVKGERPGKRWDFRHELIRLMDDADHDGKVVCGAHAGKIDAERGPRRVDVDANLVAVDRHGCPLSSPS